MNNPDMPSLDVPEKGIRGLLREHLHIHHPAPDGIHTAFVREVSVAKRKKWAFMVLKWSLEKNPSTRAIEYLNLSENTPERAQSLKRIVRLMTACWRPLARPKEAQELVGLTCRIRVQRHRGWSKETGLVPMVMDYSLALQIDANGLDDDDISP